MISREVNDSKYFAVYPLDYFTELTTATHSTKATSWLDRTSLFADYETASVVAFIEANLPTAATCTYSANVQEATSSTGAGAADFGSSTQSVVVGSTASTAAQTATQGALKYSFKLREANQYVRLQHSVAFSSASTSAANDVAVFAGLYLGGKRELPST